MRRLDPCLAPAGYSPRRYETLSPAPVLGMGERMTDLRDIQALFANGEQGGYWPADPQYAYEDSAGTIAASVNGVVGKRTDVALGKHAIQATTANKPYLRRTPVSNKFWLDSNTATGALTATFPSAIGQRNLTLYTESIGTTGQWSNISGRTVIQLNSALSPAGTLTATKLVRSTTPGSQRLVSNAILCSVGQSFTVSVYAKAGENYIFSISVNTSYELGQFGAIFNLSNQSITTSNTVATMTNIGDGWYRCILTGVTTQNDISTWFYALNNNGSYTDPGNNVDGIYLWGAQLEPGSTCTEYQKIVDGPSSVLDPTALSATYPQNITASTNCTIACVTPEGVVIADNQTVGTTYSICPPYGYNSDVLIINRALTAAEKALVTRILKRNTPYYPSIVDARLQMRGYAPDNENTVDTSIITNFSLAWYGCSSLTSFPLINTAAGTDFSNAWRECSSLTSFPLINTAAGTNFSYAWYGCSGLTSFPANFFDSWTGVPVSNCFLGTWGSCIKLTLASVQNIVVSLVVSGKSAPATGTDISLDGAPTLVAIQADTTVMTAVATLKSRNWTPKYKGTAL